MTTVTKVTDPSTYDVPTLTKWYIDLRKHKSDLEGSIKIQVEQTKAQMDAIEAELNKRLNGSDVKSMRSEFGTVSQVAKTKYTVSDPFAFRQWVERNPELAARVINAAVSQGEIKAFVEDGNALPDGVAIDNYLTISVRRA